MDLVPAERAIDLVAQEVDLDVDHIKAAVVGEVPEVLDVIRR
jgi:hypothetical protein